MTPSYDLSVLLGRVEGAAGPDRELDLAIGLALAGWEVGPIGGFGGEYLHAGHVSYAWPTSPGAGYESFTESLDAALALTERVAPHAFVELSEQMGSPDTRANRCWIATVSNYLPDGDGWRFAGGHEVTAKTGPLALLAALLKALIAQAGDTSFGETNE